LHHAGLELGPAVGVGLHTHPGNAVFGICDHEVNWYRGATQGAYFHPPGLHGVLPHTSNLPPEVALLAMTAQGIPATEGMKTLKHLTCLLVMVSDTSSGTVKAWPDGRANISYHFNDHDVARVKAGMVESAKVLLAGGARELFCPVAGTKRVTTAEAVGEMLTDRTIKDFTLYASHPMSTCRMGKGVETSVIRPDGRTHLIEGLYLADSSVFPTSLGVNPSVTTMAMAGVIGQGIARSG
jgi:choline dehydrogenase-like flavoprotein